MRKQTVLVGISISSIVTEFQLMIMIEKKKYEKCHNDPYRYGTNLKLEGPNSNQDRVT